MRAPVTESYTTSAKKVAVCATMGEEDKVKRYKGKAVPMVKETFGRLGPETEKVLNLLAMAVGHTARATLVLRRPHWFATADAALQALG